MWFEEFVVGRVYDHESARSVTSFDNIWYSNMTMNRQPLHINEDFSLKNSVYNKPLFNSLYTLAIVIGQTSEDLTHQTLVEVRNITDFEIPRPVFAGDTLYSRTTVKSVDAGDNHEYGLVKLFHEGFNQSRELVMSCLRTIAVRKKPAGQ
jgi:itaconyl-CoA hydratase